MNLIALQSWNFHTTDQPSDSRQHWGGCLKPRATTRPTCKYLQVRAVYVLKLGKTWAKFVGPHVVSTASVRIWEHADTAVEILVHAELSLRSGYGFTPSTDDAGTSTANVRTTYSLREFFTIFPMVTCSTDGVLSTVRGPCVVRAWSVRGPCLLRTSQVQLSNEQTELTWTVPSKHVLRTYNALIWRAGHVLTTCATVRLTCVYILPLCSCHSLTTFSEKNVAGLASPKNVRKKTRRMGCARGLTTNLNWLHQCVIYWWARCRNKTIKINKTINNFKWNGLTNLC